MTNPTDNQVKRFWGKCGFTYTARNVIGEWFDKGMAWVYPDGTIHKDPPVTDLNNLFKYAVPKLAKEGYWFVFSPHNFKSNMWIARVKYFDFLGHKEEYSSKSETPDLALFWAIYKAFGLEE